MGRHPGCGRSRPGRSRVDGLRSDATLEVQVSAGGVAGGADQTERLALLDDVAGWTLSPDDELAYLREYEHVTLARVLVARHASDCSEQVLADAIGLLQRLLGIGRGRRQGRNRDRDPGAPGARASEGW